jgi:ATP-binding cassette, subfamily B, bacterial
MIRNSIADYLVSLPIIAHTVSTDPSCCSADPSMSFAQQLRGIGAFGHGVVLMGVHALATVLLLLSWYFLGSAALSGRADTGWLLAWALALSCTVPLRVVSRWLEGVVTIGFGGLLRQRMLVGAMALEPDSMRASGTGELLSEVLETDTIDTLGAVSLVQAGLGIVELVIAVLLLMWVINGTVQVVLLLMTLVLALHMMRRNLQQCAALTQYRLTLTARLVENMAAHRTRLAQQSPGDWHRIEDDDLAQYLVASRAMDGLSSWLIVIPRVYVLVAVAVLGAAFVSGHTAPAALAITFGAILFAATAFEHFVMGYSRGIGAWVAWRVAQPIFEAGAKLQAPVSAEVASGLTSAPILIAHELSYRHHERKESVLKGCALTVLQGDKILLQGNSGSGKSTLAALLTGQRMPSSGFILASGLDHHTLGTKAWRQRVATVPQYHENHILSATLAFNLLLGRLYPHTPADCDDATKVCEELGLGPLIARMPSGLNEMVGETGWKLSQGEASRVFLARALLQPADVVVLDEAFAALDPDTLAQCLDYTMRRISTLILIAHP